MFLFEAATMGIKMKKYLVGGAIGFIALPLFLVAVYGPTSLLHLQTVVAADPMEKDDTLSYFDATDEGLIDTKASFIAKPGTWPHLDGNTIYRLEPVLHLRDSTNFETCFTVKNIDTTVFTNALGLRVSLEPDDQQILKSALDVNNHNIFTLELGVKEFTRFAISSGDNPQQAYNDKIINRPDEADIIFIANNLNVPRLMRFAASLTPGRRPPACEGDDNLQTVNNWNSLLEHFFPINKD